ncbi:F420-dependent protein [Carbonactinospora thermoautotrophica]|uniref:F420-dependent protein n=3 Tax=Carbonactinospora thermoautotrophica TaxID=1469144 RepID=A0A132MI45_9ACTN|nr:TIGR03668 family PPOX class F420-dependent oxidoreductase [Carbonactinospora thermoautotrophica]KWW97439.1 F420-dependent protein [Carbonactinospora thermoautotrophica]KWW98692.1 putative F420-dependent enzyme [Carbonactinospora thermoautotrophica]
MRLTDAECRARFAAARVAHLATAGADGAPRLVPVTFALVGEVIATAVDAKPKRTRQLRRLRDIAENPRVAVLADHYEEDWTRLWWVRADGEASVRHGEERGPYLAALVAKYPQYRQVSPDGPVILIRVDRWTGWAFRG